MKVAMLSSVPADYGGSSGGGIGVHTAAVARHLAQMGVQVAVLAHNVLPPAPRLSVGPHGFAVHRFAPVRSVAALGHLLRSLPGLPWRTLTGPHRFGALHLSARQQAAALLLAAQYDHFIREVRPDVVHYHGGGSGLAAACAVTGRRNLPLVVTLHSIHGWGDKGEEFPGYLFPSLRRADAVIAVSETLQDEVVSLGIPSDTVRAIPNGVDTEYFHPLGKEEACRRLEVPTDTFNVLFVGHLIGAKGVDLLVTAFARFCQPGPGARLYIVGGPVSYTETSWHQELLALPRTLGIVDRVSFVGPVESHREPTLNLWYNAADALVLPSRSEGMGMVLVEAMACGKPVVGTRVGGIPNVIRDGWNGLLVPPEDVEGLAHALTRLAQDPALAQRLGAQGLQDARTAYRWDAVAEKTLEVYRSLVASSAR